MLLHDFCDPFGTLQKTIRYQFEGAYHFVTFDPNHLNTLFFDLKLDCLVVYSNKDGGYHYISGGKSILWCRTYPGIGDQQTP